MLNIFYLNNHISNCSRVNSILNIEILLGLKLMDKVNKSADSNCPGMSPEIFIYQVN